MPPTQPLNPVVPPAAPYVAEMEFPGLDPSPKQGIGGIPGCKDFPQGTFEGFQAFKKPDARTVMPRPTTSKTASSTTTTVTVSTTSTVDH